MASPGVSGRDEGGGANSELSLEDRVSRACAQVFKEMKEDEIKREERHEGDKRELQSQIEKLQQSLLNNAEVHSKDALIQDQSSRIEDLVKTCERFREERDEWIDKHAKISQSYNELNRKHGLTLREGSHAQVAIDGWRNKFLNTKDRVEEFQKWTGRATPPGSRHSRADSKDSPSTDVHRPLTPVSELIYSSDAADNLPFALDNNVTQAERESGAAHSPTLPDKAVDALCAPAPDSTVVENAIATCSRQPRQSGRPFTASSQTTEDDNSGVDSNDAAVKVEAGLPSSSPPRVVSERPAPGRRSKRETSGLEHLKGFGTTNEPFLIKEESSNSHQSLILDYPHLRPQGSGDLDTQTKSTTPRKRRRLERARSIRQANGMSHKMASNLSYERAESLPHEIPCGNANSNRDPLQISFHEVIADDLPSQEARQEVLAPIDANQQILSRVGHPAMPKKRRHRRDSDIRHFAEDGESFRYKSIRAAGRIVAGRRVPNDGQQGDVVRHTRVNNLLEEPALPNTHAVQKSNTSKSVQKSASPTPGVRPGTFATPKQLPTAEQPFMLESGELDTTRNTISVAAHPQTPQTPQTAPLPLKRTTFQSLQDQSERQPNTVPRQRPRQASTSSAPFRTPGVSLRSLSPSRLTLADFKINASANSNESFAYHETLRKAAEKACRPGCTDQNCCGGYWRKLAELQFDVPPPSPTKPNASLSISGEQALDDHQLLVNFLGGGPWAQQRAKAMKGDERREMILDARAAELAQKHGKHRQRFQRRRTPPGFWRTDFPNTQEVGKESEEAEKMRKEMVRERWREAVQDGGVWSFRDE